MLRNIGSIVRDAIPKRKEGSGKGGAKLVQRAIQRALEDADFVVDFEDSRCFLQKRMPVWQRCGEGCHIVEPTAKRRRIDLVVYGNPNDLTPLALVEVESDLADMGRKTRKGYDVTSIANDAAGNPFSSYMSVERMAAAVQFWTMKQAIGRYPTCDEGVARLRAIRSDGPAEHNPTDIDLFLACEEASQKHVQLLQRRLGSLGMVQPLVGTLKP